MRIMFNLLAAGAVTALAAGTPAATAKAAEFNTTAGKQLAKEWCAACHVVEEGQGETMSTAAPSFLDVAADPAVTEMSLRAFFASPHEQMPDIQLSNAQTDDIIAYILSLRTP
ncbi:MAG: c-type cytochrome [Dongiaceae bacterium]